MFIEAKDDGGGGDSWITGAISRASSQTITTNKPTSSFLQAGCPSCRPTKALKGKYQNVIWDQRCDHIILFSSLLLLLAVMCSSWYSVCYITWSDYILLSSFIFSDSEGEIATKFVDLLIALLVLACVCMHYVCVQDNTEDCEQI